MTMVICKWKRVHEKVMRDWEGACDKRRENECIGDRAHLLIGTYIY